MSRRATVAQDLTRARSLLAGTPFPPNVSDDAVAEIVADGWTFVEGDAMIRVVPDPDARHVEIPWWLPLRSWLGEGMDAMIAAAEAVLAEYGDRARLWTIGGTFQAPGETSEDRRERSRNIALIHKQWLPTVLVTPADGTTYYRATDIVGRLYDAARAWRGG